MARSWSSRYTDLDALPRDFINRWSIPGDEKITNIPSIAALYDDRDFNSLNEYPYNNYNYSDQRVADGGFVRLKWVSLRYGLPQGLLQSTPLKSAVFTLTGNNLWLIYSDEKLRGQDPEFFNAGGVALPINKQFTLSLKVGF
jgi:hypothetical protein